MGPHAALANWRKAAGLNQDEVVAALAELGARVARPTYSFWEKDRRPGYEHAVAIEALSKGAVKVESWGYSAASALELARLRAVEARRTARARRALPPASAAE
jgi:transcriptional regulator with XRE-family HTH domain